MNSHKKQNKKEVFVPKQSGYAVLELLFYISFFAVLSIVVIDSMITMTRAFRETALSAELLHSGAIMETISREIRQADSFTLLSSNDLKLNTKDDAGVSKTVEFLQSGTDVNFLENSVLTGALNTSNIVVTNLAFTQITTTVGSAVKVFFTVGSTNDSANRTFDYYDTVVLRGNY